MSLLAVVASGCGQEHLQLGALAGDTGLVDAADGADAALDATVATQRDAAVGQARDASSEAGLLDQGLDVTLRALGRAYVGSITTRCSSDCFDVEAVGSGGLPPYTFTWQLGNDGGAPQTGQSVRVCGSHSSVDVTMTDDKRDGTAASASLAVSLRIDPCDTLFPLGWSVCSMYPLRPNECSPNPRGPFVIPLGHTLDESATASLSLTTSLSLLEVELQGGAGCEPSYSFGRVPTWGNGYLQFGTLKAPPGTTHLRVRTLGTSDEAFPLGLDPSFLYLCEELTISPQ